MDVSLLATLGGIGIGLLGAASTAILTHLTAKAKRDVEGRDNVIANWTDLVHRLQKYVHNLEKLTAAQRRANLILWDAAMSGQAQASEYYLLLANLHTQLVRLGAPDSSEPSPAPPRTRDLKNELSFLEQVLAIPLDASTPPYVTPPPREGVFSTGMPGPPPSSLSPHPGARSKSDE